MSELKHYGIQGQKWGIRRWQNADGSFNEEGKKRYGRIGKGIRNANQRRLQSAYNASMEDAAYLRKHGYKEEAKAVEKVARNLKDYLDNYSKSGSVLTPKQKQILKTGVIAVASGLAVIGASKVIQNRVEIIKQQKAYDTAGRRFMEFQNESAKRAWDEINAKIEKAEKAKVTAESNIIDRHEEVAKAIGKMVNDMQSNVRDIRKSSAENRSRLADISKALEDLNESIDTARELGVPEIQIIKGKGDLDDYFTGGKKMTRQEFNPEKYNPISIYTREHGNIGATGYRLPEKENKLLQMISKITYPTNSSAYEEAVIRAAKQTGNTIYDAKNVARKYQKAVESSQESPSKGELNFYATTASIKSGLDNIQRIIDKEWPKN